MVTSEIYRGTTPNTVILLRSNSDPGGLAPHSRAVRTINLVVSHLHTRKCRFIAVRRLGGWWEDGGVGLVINLNGVNHRCRGAHRGVNFVMISRLTHHLNMDFNGRSHDTCVTRCHTPRGVVVVGPAACVGLDNITMNTCTGFCRVSPSSVTIVRSSVSVPMNRLHVHHGNDTNNRGNVGSVARRLNASTCPHFGVNVNRPTHGGGTIIGRMLRTFRNSSGATVRTTMTRVTATLRR